MIIADLKVTKWKDPKMNLLRRLPGGDKIKKDNTSPSFFPF